MNKTPSHQPVYETPPSSYLAEQILQILLDPNIDPWKACHGIPTDVTKSSTYIVDLASLKHPKFMYYCS